MAPCAVRFRRSAADRGCCREGPPTDPVADAQACVWELVKMDPIAVIASSHSPGFNRVEMRHSV